MNIYQLKVKINTKIPNHLEFELSSDILVHDVKISLLKYPLFMDNRLYPRKVLQNYDYNEIVKFFFNNRAFTDIMKNINVNPKSKNKTNRINIKNIKQKQNVTRKNVNANANVDTNIIAHENFTLMLQLLFPTTFPLVNSIETSLSYLLTDKQETIPFIKNDQNNKLRVQKFFSFKGTNPTLFQFLPIKFDRKFAYLKFDNTIYTITRVIWINDVMNHPIYKDILLKYHVFEQWRNKYEPDIDMKDQEMQYEIVKFINRIMQKTNNPLILGEVKKGLLSDDKNPYGIRRDKNELLINRIVIALTELDNLAEYENKSRYFKNTSVDINKKIVEYFIVVINIFESLNDRGLFSGSYENLDNIRRKIKEYELTRDINDYIMDLNFEYLNEDTKNPRSNEIVSRINTYFPEFNNFVKVIRDMKTRVVYNPVWRNTITKIIRGEKDHNFEDLWYEINNCYSITDLESSSGKGVENVELKEKENLEKKRKEKKILFDLQGKQKEKGEQKETRKRKWNEGLYGGEKTSKCKNANYELNVGFDIINQVYNQKETEKNTITPTLKTIEVYLQMDIIAGKVTEKNMGLLKCPYNDNFLGDMYENLLFNSKEQWNISNKILYFDGKELLEKKDQKQKQGDQKQKQGDQKQKQGDQNKKI